MKVEIRQEAITDFLDVSWLNKAAFGQDTEANLVDLLRNSPAFIPELSLVATSDNKIVGHILFTKINIINGNGNKFTSLALAPMSVRPDLQRQGIGGQLVLYGLHKATALGYTSAIVVGHEHYYPKFGFVPTGKWNIKAPFDVSANVFMGIELVKDAFQNIEGTVQYPNEFNLV